MRLGGGRVRGTVVAVLVAGWALAGCGRSGSVLVDSSTTAPVPTATATAGLAATASPTTRGIPSTTGTVPVTTARAGPAGQAITFRAMTIRLRASWRAAVAGDQVAVVDGRPCRRSPGRVDCPGFLLLGPAQIAIADELGPYDPERVWHPGTGVEGCPQDRDGLAEQAPTRPVEGGRAKVGGRDATYREWRVACVDARTGTPETAYTQRVWHLEASGILVVDEWSTPGLDQVLAAATFG